MDNTQRDVERVLNSRCRVSETEDFVQRLLPVPDDAIQKIRGMLEERMVYLNGRWTAFPLTDGGFELDEEDEDEATVAFVKSANAIREAAEGLQKAKTYGPFGYLNTCKWSDQRSGKPVLQETQYASVPPDALLTLSHCNANNEDMELGGVEGKDSTSQSTPSWLQVVCPVVAKRPCAKTWLDFIKQLVGHLRHILYEQIDRRFAFGFLLGPSHVSVAMHDRSGVLMTAKSIDIHENPDVFIRLIAAFVLLPADKLGFDPSMKLYDISTGIAIPSYTTNSLQPPQSRHDMQWVIKLNNGKEYLTVKTLSISHAGIADGNGTIAWAVVPYPPEPSRTNRASGNQRKVFVLKQSWRPLKNQSEGYFYDFAKAAECDKIGVIDVCEDAMIQGEVDGTGTLIRQGLGADTAWKEGRSPFLRVHINGKGIRVWVEGISPLVSRVRTRALLSTYGWPLKHFSSLKELLQVIRDAIEAHKYLYAHGILHRDISSRNIIIKRKPAPGSTDAVTYGGCLIDLDLAKVGRLDYPKIDFPTAQQLLDGKAMDGDELTCYISLVTSSARKTLQSLDKTMEDLHVFITPTAALKDVDKLRVQNDVLELAYSARGDELAASSYAHQAVVHLVRFSSLSDSVNGVCSAANLHWAQIKKSYDFQIPGPQETITGTPPFISYEILSPDSLYFPSSDTSTSSTVNCHDAVHDMESFFWVLVYICLTCSGPGGSRRKELNIEKEMPSGTSLYDQEASYRLRNVVSCLFGNSVTQLQDNKYRIFTKSRHSGSFEQYVIANFHPYFDALKPLVSEWFSLLRLAHEFHGYEYHAIHDRVLMILDKELKHISSGSQCMDTDELEVLEIRKADIARVLGFDYGGV